MNSIAEKLRFNRFERRSMTLSAGSSPGFRGDKGRNYFPCSTLAKRAFAAVQDWQICAPPAPAPSPSLCVLGSQYSRSYISRGHIVRIADCSCRMRLPYLDDRLYSSTRTHRRLLAMKAADRRVVLVRSRRNRHRPITPQELTDSLLLAAALIVVPHVSPRNVDVGSVLQQLLNLDQVPTRDAATCSGGREPISRLGPRVSFLLEVAAPITTVDLLPAASVPALSSSSSFPIAPQGWRKRASCSMCKATCRLKLHWLDQDDRYPHLPA